MYGVDGMNRPMTPKECNRLDLNVSFHFTLCITVNPNLLLTIRQPQRQSPELFPQPMPPIH